MNDDDSHAISFAKFLPAILLIIVLVVAVIFHTELAKLSVARTSLVLIFTGACLFGAAKVFFGARNMSDPSNVRFVISFDSLVFIILGLAATTISCENWAVADMLAGACLLIGGFFGLLFGYPQGVAQQSTQPKSGVATTQTSSRDKNLLAESAATLGKVLAGFTLAKVSTITGHFWHLCQTLGPVLGGQNPPTNLVLAGVILTYFLATGFLSGLLLPSYFMSDFLNNSIAADTVRQEGQQ